MCTILVRRRGRGVSRTKTRISWAILEYTMEASLDGLSEVGILQMAKLEPGEVELGVGAKEIFSR